jgi:hypothetical protein
MAPGSFSVPPLVVKVDEVVNADAIESVFPLIDKGSAPMARLIGYLLERVTDKG